MLRSLLPRETKAKLASSLTDPRRPSKGQSQPLQSSLARMKALCASFATSSGGRPKMSKRKKAWTSC